MKLIILTLTSLILLCSNSLAAPTPPPPADTTFINTVLTRVNNYRNHHSAAPLTWDATLASYARTQANGCKAVHSGKYGENIYSFWTTDADPSFVTWTNSAIDWWMSEAANYNVNNPAPAYHFTQLVWKSSKRIGCAWSVSKCPDKNYYLYCEFDPMGNIAGQFVANVS
ncbi:MAG: hypothetical protein M1813_006214 [Trichoglossum hirsutum]|nr:MAG: hypothetical protein M1813_006214 [Trichoglossum hirsutum]